MFFDGEIRISEATDLPSPFREALEKWRAEAEEILHGGIIQWYSKLVMTRFEYHGKKYVIYPKDVFSAEVFEEYAKKYLDNFLEAGLEILQPSIAEDLKALGATKIQSFGFLD